MNLRDIITEKIKYNYCRGAVKQSAENTTDEILNLFEKRIDELASKIPDPHKINVYKEDGYADLEKYGNYRMYDGQLELIEKIKEMLK